MNELILIYGAGGAQGAPVAHQLLRQGHRVRCLVTDYNKNRALQLAGADVVVGDLGNLESLRRAHEGVDKVFLMLPFSAGGNPLQYAEHALQAALEGGVSLLVLNTSGQTPAALTGHPMMDYRIHLESMVRASNIPSIVLRPTAYMENFLGPWVLPRLQAEDVVAYPVGVARPTSWISAEDLGRLAVAAMERPELAGQTFNVGGPDALTGADIARSFSAGLGRDIRYEAISPEAFGKIMGQMMGPDAEAGIVAAYRTGEAAPLDAMVVDMVPVLSALPVELTSLETWVRNHAHVLEPALSR